MRYLQKNATCHRDRTITCAPFRGTGPILKIPRQGSILMTDESSCGPAARHGLVHISAPIAALVEGLYRSDTRLGDLRAKGDFGIGTFNDLDGEMVLLDGTFYCLRPNGPAEIMGDNVRTPFAMCMHFSAHTEEEISRPIEADTFEAFLTDLIPSRNLVYGIRIKGHFRMLRFRSVPKQANYSPLAEIAKVQTVTTIEDVDATLVGFYTPGFLASIHMPGLHLHVLTADRLHGGHLLSAATEHVSVALQHALTVELALPLTIDFLTYEKRRDIEADLNAVER